MRQLGEVSAHAARLLTDRIRGEVHALALQRECQAADSVKVNAAAAVRLDS